MIVITVVCFIIALPLCATEDGGETVDRKGKVYSWVRQPATWNDAYKSCMLKNQSLLRIENIIDQNVANHIGSTFSLDERRQETWISMLVDDGKYKDGQCVDISDPMVGSFGGTLPSNTDGERSKTCVKRMWETGNWTTEYCDVLLEYICEKERDCHCHIKSGVQGSVSADDTSAYAPDIATCQKNCVARSNQDDYCFAFSYFKDSSNCTLHLSNNPLAHIIPSFKKNSDSSQLGTLHCYEHRKQWVNKIVDFSSQYQYTGSGSFNVDDWYANKVIGPPDVYPRYGDYPGSWAQQYLDEYQFIIVRYLSPMIIKRIRVFETLHAGGVKTILMQSQNGSWSSVWANANIRNANESNILQIDENLPQYCTDTLRVDVDCTAANKWVEIDAISIKGLGCFEPVIREPDLSIEPNVTCYHSTYSSTTEITGSEMQSTFTNSTHTDVTTRTISPLETTHVGNTPSSTKTITDKDLTGATLQSPTEAVFVNATQNSTKVVQNISSDEQYAEATDHTTTASTATVIQFTANSTFHVYSTKNGEATSQPIISSKSFGVLTGHSCRCVKKNKDRTIDVVVAELVLMNKIKELKASLTVEKSKMSVYHRKRNSATDNRQSSKAVGIFGFGIMFTVFGGLVALDVVPCICNVMQIVRKRLSKRCSAAPTND